MNASQPPRIATWLLKRLASRPKWESLMGDLIEQHQRGRSAAWYWKQVVTAIFLSRSRALLLTGGVLVVYWIGHYIPIPGANTNALAALARGPHWSTFKYDLFTGGNLAPVTIFALGVMPYVSAAIFVQVLALVSSLIRRTARLAPRRVRQYTWVVAILLSMLQAH